MVNKAAFYKYTGTWKYGGDNGDAYFDPYGGERTFDEAGYNAAVAREEAARQAEIKAKNDATYGSGQTLGSVQDLFTQRANLGAGFQKSAADVARDIINGIKPTQASIGASQNVDLGVQSVGQLVNASPNVNAGVDTRNAINMVNQQQSDAMKKAAMARANEIAAARQVIAGTGSNIQGLGLTNYGNQLKVQQGLMAQASNEKAQADMANRQQQASERAAGLGALSAGLAVL
jgi:hypothetical protein